MKARREMAIKHILKDGTVLYDITGHIVRMQDAPTVYTVFDEINNKKQKKRKVNKK